MVPGEIVIFFFRSSRLHSSWRWPIVGLNHANGWLSCGRSRGFII